MKQRVLSLYDDEDDLTMMVKMMTLINKVAIWLYST
jgi:hypothetical protein